MTEQAKIYRVLKLISMLKQRGRQVDELAAYFDVDPRTIYRYLNLLEDLGFMLDKDFHDRYFIAEYDDEVQGIQFAPEEAGFLKELIETGAHSHPLKNSVLKKLYLNSEIKELSEDILKARTAQLIRKMVIAQANENQVILSKYHSASSGDIRDRKVEIVHFSEDYENVFVFDLDDRKTKNFKVERVGDVVELTTPIQFRESYRSMTKDLFGMTGDGELSVEIRLSFKAYLLLREEHPLSIPFLTAENTDERTYLLKAVVTDYAGVSRFALGLIDQVEVLGPEEFKAHLNSLLNYPRFS